MAGEAICHPGQIGGIGDPIEESCVRCGQEHQLDPVDHLSHRTDSLNDGTSDVDQRLPLLRCGGIEVHQAAHARRRPIGHTGDHHAPVAVADEDDIGQILEMQDGEHIFDVPVQVDLAVEEV